MPRRQIISLQHPPKKGVQSEQRQMAAKKKSQPTDRPHFRQ